MTFQIQCQTDLKPLLAFIARWHWQHNVVISTTQTTTSSSLYKTVI